MKIAKIKANLRVYLENLEKSLINDYNGKIERNHYNSYQWSEFYYYSIRSIAMSLGNIIVKGTTDSNPTAHTSDGTFISNNNDYKSKVLKFLPALRALITEADSTSFKKKEDLDSFLRLQIDSLYSEFT
ncbi:hypothetical protein N9J85_00100 [bacterium]|nr:hypothetical protein [bacterium]